MGTSGDGSPQGALYPLIRVIGSANTGKKSLLWRLLEATGQQVPERLQRGAWSEGDRCLWVLDTKYYTADVQIDTVSLTEPQLQGPASLPDALEAIVAVVDAGSQGSWTATNKWLEQADLDSCETRICVVNKAELCDVTTLPWMEDLQEWCLCNMFEFIQVCCADPMVDATLADECGDVQGVARVVAALSAHMWSNMSIKDRARVAHAAPGEQDEAQLEPPLVGVPADEKPTHKQDSTVEPIRPGVVKNGAATDVSLIPDDGEEEFDEYAQMEAMMAKLVGHREQIMLLPDEERRERAAGLAMQLMGMMGLDDDEDEAADP